MPKKRLPDTFLALLLLLLALPAQAETPLPEFSHDYHIYRGETTAARARMRLYPVNGYWVWELKSEPVGWLRLLTRKKPYSETWLRLQEDEPRLMLSRSGDYKDKPAERSTWFDHDKGRLYYAKKDKTRQLDFQGPVYDYLTVHLLYPKLLEQPDRRLEIPFYKKGKIKKSQLTLEPEVTLRSGDKTLTLDRVTQTLEGSDKRMIYYYRRGEIAPVKIEQYKGKNEKSVMWRDDVK